MDFPLVLHPVNKSQLTENFGKMKKIILNEALELFDRYWIHDDDLPGKASEGNISSKEFIEKIMDLGKISNDHKFIETVLSYWLQREGYLVFNSLNHDFGAGLIVELRNGKRLALQTIIDQKGDFRGLLEAHCSKALNGCDFGMVVTFEEPSAEVIELSNALKFNLLSFETILKNGLQIIDRLAIKYA